MSGKYRNMNKWEESVEIWMSERKVSKYEWVREKYQNMKEWGGKYRNMKEWDESIEIWMSERKVSKYE